MPSVALANGLEQLYAVMLQVIAYSKEGFRLARTSRRNRSLRSISGKPRKFDRRATTFPVGLLTHPFVGD
jgi:hypothetical protein